MGPPKPTSFPSVGAKEEDGFPTPKPCMGTQSVFQVESTEKGKNRDGQKERSAGLGDATTASPTTWPSFAPTNLKAERFGARKSTELKRAVGKVW